MLVLGMAAAVAAASSTAPQVPQRAYAGLHWRLLGPFRGGRVLAVTGVPGEPNHFYFGAVGGGVWESHNAGRTWTPIFDRQSIASIGAIAVAPSAPNVLYVGTGEADMRSDITYGDGVYKSTDGGKSWTHLGLDDTRHIGRIVVDPHNPDIVFVAALGHAYDANAERGVFRSTDGGKTWKKVLYKNASTGAVDLALDPSNPRTVYASLWQTRRPPWNVYPPAQGPGSGLYKSTDGGETWHEIVGHGFPSQVGRIGIDVAPSDPERVYALVDGKTLAAGGLYRSDDGGRTWRHVYRKKRIWQRGWYFGHLTVDPKDADTVYVCNTVLLRSTDGGKSFVPIKGDATGDDYQQIWINPHNPDDMIVGADQGAVVSVDHGKTWSSWYNQPTGQFYHVVTDDQFPYHVYGPEQDSGAVSLPTRSDNLFDGITLRNLGEIAAGGEKGYLAPDPRNPRVVFGGTVSKFDKLTAQNQDVDPTLAYPGIWRSTWTLPLVFSPANPHALYFANQRVFETDNGGRHWQPISPDLTRKHPGVPPNLDNVTAADNLHNGPRRGVVYTIAPSPRKACEIWAGTDDGLIWLTHDDGGHWNNVTPKALTPWSKVSIIEASHFDTNTAYAAVDRHRLGDLKPYIYRTTDGGRHWHKIVNGIPNGSFVRVVREDPKRRGLLFAGTETGIYVSFDNGDRWQSLQLNLPVASIRDIAIRHNDLVIATHGRAFWVLDDIEPLRQLSAKAIDSNAWLYKPATAYRIHPAAFLSTPMPKDEPHALNPPVGAMIDYWLKSKPTTPVAIDILDDRGDVVRHYSSANKLPPLKPTQLRVAPAWVHRKAPPSSRVGMHRFVWDLHYALPGALKGISFRDTGVWAPPGHYRVRLKVNGQTLTRPLTVKEDPRVKTSRAGLKKQFALAKKIEAVRVRLAKVSDQANKLLKRLNAERQNGASASAKRRYDQAVAIAGQPPAENPDNSVGVPPSSSTTLRYLAGAFARLEYAVESADRAPTPDMLTGFKKQSAKLKRTLSRWQALRKH
jgi:photosystem II stability/assembly factor-like uncharacterized protein